MCCMFQRLLKASSGDTHNPATTLVRACRCKNSAAALLIPYFERFVQGRNTQRNAIMFTCGCKRLLTLFGLCACPGRMTVEVQVSGIISVAFM